MATNKDSNTDYTPTQHPIISQATMPETIMQFLFTAAVVGAMFWIGLAFQTMLLVFLILGFTLTTMNIISSAVSQNFHLAEIRDAILEQNKLLERQGQKNSN